MLEVLRQDYIRTARAKGASWRQVIVDHALKNALIPVVTVVGIQVGAILEGALVTESIFSWPGVGKLAIDSIFGRDYPNIQGIIAIWLPRRSCRSSSPAVARSVPIKRMRLSGSIRPGGSMSRMIDSAVTLMPQPDSPTSPSVRPCSNENVTPSTARMTPSLVWNQVRISSTRSSSATNLKFCAINRLRQSTARS